MPLSGRLEAAYWSEEYRERTELLDRAVAYLTANRWGKVVDSGWQEWDLQVFCHPWSVVEVCTSQEDHGGGKRLIRVRYRLRLSGYTRGIALMAVFAGLTAAVMGSGPLAVGAAALAGLCLAGWWRGTRRAGRVVGLFDSIARGLNLMQCRPAPTPRTATAAVPARGEGHRPIGVVPLNGTGALEFERMGTVK
jgi:hypothetical protein